MKERLNRTKSVGLVLSGGGVRGMAHIGLLRALNANGISPSHVSGTSVGAIVGALFCNGNNTDDMLAFFRETPLFRYNFLTLNKPGLLDTERYSEIFKTYFPHDSFEALQKTLFVTTTNLQKGVQHVFQDGPLIRPLLASAALPPVFSPVEIDNCLHADGGILDNFPSEILLGQCDYMIGSNVSALKSIGKDGIRTSLQLANRTTALMIYAINKDRMASCDLLFEPDKLDQIGVLDKRSLEKAHDIGYDHASHLLEMALA